jgi:protein ImuB
VLDAAGRPVAMRERGAMTGEPARFKPGASEAWQPVAAWAGPWPVDERWWEPGDARRPLVRFQLVGVDGRAWLVACEGAAWRTEAAYD